MNNYNLATLLKIREHKKNAAENHLKDASYQHTLASNKLSEIEASLKKAITARCKLQQDFFQKSQISPSNKREITCHLSSNFKNMWNEEQLKKSLLCQKEQVRQAQMRLEVAKMDAILAHRNLKIIEKHLASWQQQKRRAEEIKEEYINDDQNTVRFLLKKI